VTLEEFGEKIGVFRRRSLRFGGRTMRLQLRLTKGWHMRIATVSNPQIITIVVPNSRSLVKLPEST
jgi:hypothetical protein